MKFSLRFCLILGVMALALLGLSMPLNAQAESIASSKTANTLEKRLLGKHLFSLQAISREKFGSAKISREDGALHIEASQTLKDECVILNGTITIVDDSEFIVDGTLVTRIRFYNDGNICERNGKFNFKATGNRKYWRLQQMEDPCYHTADFPDMAGIYYVDIYFK
jgi:hypothetical protein